MPRIKGIGRKRKKKRDSTRTRKKIATGSDGDDASESEAEEDHEWLHELLIDIADSAVDLQRTCHTAATGVLWKMQQLVLPWQRQLSRIIVSCSAMLTGKHM